MQSIQLLANASTLTLTSITFLFSPCFLSPLYWLSYLIADQCVIVSDIAIFVLKRDVKLQLTHSPVCYLANFQQVLQT